MMKNHTQYILGTLLTIIAYNSFISASAESDVWVQEEIPAHIIAYLKNHEVDIELRTALDALFSRPEVYRPLALIYTETNKHRAKRLLAQEGFIFSSRKTHVFQHISFPQYIFKIGKITGSKREIKCANRIRMAEIIRETAAQLNYKITTPQKYCYFPNQDLRYPLPQIIILAEKIDLHEMDKRLTEKQKRECKIIQELTHIVDLALGKNINTVSLHGTVYIIDTEEELARVSYSHE